MSGENDELIQLQKEHLKVQIELGKKQINMETWKVIAAAFSAGAAFTIAMTALATFILLQLGVK